MDEVSILRRFFISRNLVQLDASLNALCVKSGLTRSELDPLIMVALREINQLFINPEDIWKLAAQFRPHKFIIIATDGTTVEFSGRE